MVLECLNDGGLIIFPTDTIYSMGGSIRQPKVLNRICTIKGIKKGKANFSFIFHDLSMLSEFTAPRASVLYAREISRAGAWFFCFCQKMG